MISKRSQKLFSSWMCDNHGVQISIELTIDSLTYDTQIVGNIAFVINS